MASPTDTYEKWKGNLLMGIVGGLAVVEISVIVSAPRAVDLSSWYFNGIYVLAACMILFLAVDLFRGDVSLMRTSPKIQAAAASFWALAALGFSVGYCMRFASAGLDRPWLRAAQVFMNALMATMLFRTAYKSRKSHV
jgi:hypothetical protein